MGLASDERDNRSMHSKGERSAIRAAERGLDITLDRGTRVAVGTRKDRAQQDEKSIHPYLGRKGVLMMLY